MRADKFFAEKFGSRTKAAEAIEKGLVKVGGKTVRPKDEVKETDEIVFIQPNEYYVSNGGYKLARAIRAFSLNVEGKIFADIGASTGGFTDCLLQNGAKKVYAVDVGESLLDEKLKNDNRVISLENLNARYLTKENFSDTIEGLTADLSFISLTLVLETFKNVLKEGGEAYVLLKPQFECEHKNIGKSGIVSLAAHSKIVKKVLEFCKRIGFFVQDIVNAPVRKGKNLEYILYLKNISSNKDYGCKILQKVEEYVQQYTAGTLT